MSSAKANLDWRAYAAVFFIALGVATLYHCLDSGVKVALLFDGRHYFETSQRMTALILAAASLNPDAVMAAEQSLREYIMLDGPVLPTLFGSAYALFGRVPSSADWSWIVWVQTVLHALATVLICKITFQLTRKKAVALVCCGLWAVYPSALIASGRLMTESLAVVLLLSLPLALRGAIGQGDRARQNNQKDQSDQSEPSVLMDQSVQMDQCVQTAQSDHKNVLNRISRLTEGNAYGFVAGIISGLLILLKPGMIPSVVLSWIACLLLSKTRLSVALSLMIGVGLAVSPWMLYTKQTTGKAAITVQRMPVHNALIGWDAETSGWQTNPPSGFERVMNTGGDPLTTIEGIWISNPRDCFTILLEKFGHLYSTPWNDYRNKVFGLNVQAQGAYHYLLIFMAMAGFFAWASTFERKNRLAILCLAAAGGQCVYLMFEPVCRYAFPQIAFAPVLSALFLTLLFRRSRNWKLLAVIGILAIGSVELIAQSEAKSAKRLAEVAHRLNAGDQVSTTIKLPPSALSNASDVLMLVDGDVNLENAVVEVNGHTCDGKLIIFNYYDPVRYQAFNLLKELGYGLNVKVDNFRLWRAIPIPRDLLRDQSVNIAIKPGKDECTIYGDRWNARNYLSPDFLCVNRLINSKHSMEMRNDSPILAGQSERSSTTTTGGATTPTKDNLRIRLLVAKAFKAAGTDINTSCNNNNNNNNNNKANKSSLTEDVTDFQVHLQPKGFDENMRTLQGELKISRSILKAARTTGVIQKIPAFASPNLSVTLEGEMRAVSKPGELGVVVSTVTDKHNECFLARLPSALKTVPEWTHFEITDVAPRVTRQGNVEAISLAFFPGAWQQIAGYGTDKKCTDTLLRNLTLKVRSAKIPSLSDKQLLIF
ncbi:MAG TPA: hypothetical protein V6C89_10745 [Drouetiella sp.]